MKPQSPAERLVRKRQLRELAEAEAKARGEAVKRPVGHPRSSKNKLLHPSQPH